MIEWVYDVCATVIRFKLSKWSSYKFIAKIVKAIRHKTWMKEAMNSLFSDGVNYSSIMQFSSILFIIQQYRIYDNSKSENIIEYINNNNETIKATVTHAETGGIAISIYIEAGLPTGEVRLLIKTGSANNSKEVTVEYEVVDYTPDGFGKDGKTTAFTHTFMDSISTTNPDDSANGKIISNTAELIESSIEMYLLMILFELEERL